jgi:hypothetical protein
MKLIAPFALFLLLITAGISCKKDPASSGNQEPTITATPDYPLISYNHSCTFTVEVTNAHSVSSELGTINITGNKKTIEVPTPKLTRNTTYHFLATGNEGKVDTANVTIYVDPPVAPTLTVYADNDTLYRGKSMKIYWNSTSDTTTSPDLPEVKGMTGSATISPTETKEYHFVSTIYGMSSYTSLTITVVDAPPPVKLTRADTLCMYALKLVESKYSYYPNSGPYTPIDVSAPCKQDNRLYFSPQHVLTVDNGAPCYSGEIKIGYLTWSMKGDTLTTGSGKKAIVSMDGLQVTWKYESLQEVNNYSTPIWITEKYLFQILH